MTRIPTTLITEPYFQFYPNKCSIFCYYFEFVCVCVGQREHKTITTEYCHVASIQQKGICKMFPRWDNSIENCRSNKLAQTPLSRSHTNTVVVDVPKLSYICVPCSSYMRMMMNCFLLLLRRLPKLFHMRCSLRHRHNIQCIAPSQTKGIQLERNNLNPWIFW